MTEHESSVGPNALDPTVRNWALGAHLSAFVGLWFFALSFLGPLAVWLFKRHDHPFISEHAREALNFNLSVLIYAIAAGLLIIVVIGIPILIAIFIGWIVLTIVAAVKASNGESYHYPLTIRFVTS